MEIIEQMISVCVIKWLKSETVPHCNGLMVPTSIVEIYKRGKARTVMMLKKSKENKVASYQPEVRTGRKFNAEEQGKQKYASSLEHRDIVGATCEPFKPYVCHRDNAEMQLYNASRKTKQKRENST